MVSNDGSDKQRASWKILGSHAVIDTPHLKLRADQVELPDGTIISDYFVRESRGYTIVFALTQTGDVILVRQYKHGIADEVLELPAGGIDPGETPADCAQRELAEETGYIGDPPEFIASYATDPTGSTGRFHLFVIRNATLRQAQSLDITEQIVVETAKPAQVLELVRNGEIDVSPHVTAILTIFDRVATGAFAF